MKNLLQKKKLEEQMKMKVVLLSLVILDCENRQNDPFIKRGRPKF